MTQKARLLAQLKEAGRRGVTAVDAMRMAPPILGFTARLNELRQDGHRFERCRTRRDKCVVWRLAQPTPATSTVRDAYEPAGGRSGGDPPYPPGEGVRGAQAPVRTPGFASCATTGNRAGASSHATGAQGPQTRQLQLGQRP